MIWQYGLCCAVLLSACMAAEPLPADRDACTAARHLPGTEAFEDCLQERLARQFERARGAEVDELRTRMLPR